MFHNGLFSWTTGTSSDAAYTEVAGAKSITFPVGRAELDDAAMGDDINASAPGIKSAPLSVRFRQNFASTGIDAAAYSRWDAKTKFRIRVKAVDSAASSSNPIYQWSRAYIASITPVSGGHGEILHNEIEFRPATGGTFLRGTSTSAI